MNEINLLPPRRKENIIVVSYSLDGCAVRTRPLERAGDEDLRIDLAKGLWSHRSYENLAIGTSRMISLNDRKGVIGVFDTTDPTYSEALPRTIDEAWRTINLAQKL